MKMRIIVQALVVFGALQAPAFTIVGNIPGEYLSKDKNRVYLGFVRMDQRLIKEINTIDAANVSTLSDAEGVLILKRGSADYDVIYPGLIDLHNHTKQNNLGVWGNAKGQFGSRYEWRQWSGYKDAVSGNMNPWIGFSDSYDCAAFRWSELQAMILGTTYLQGPSSCVSDFAIQRVEEAGSFISKKVGVQAPTDLLAPNEMDFVWKHLKKDIEKPGGSYAKALAAKVNELCPGLDVTPAGVLEDDLKKLKDKDFLLEKCTNGELPDGFIRYVYFIHPPIAGKIKNLRPNPRQSAVIAHLAEGARNNDFNKKEFEILKLFGFLDENEVPLNFVHGVGIPDNEFATMANKKMGLIWSPFSNLILYGETLNIQAANKAGVIVALGSDWVPTGTKSVLEEVKIALEYLEKIEKNGDTTISGLLDPVPDSSGRRQPLNVDEFLFKTMTEYPARLIRHWEIELDKKGKVVEAGVGRIAPNTMASVIVVTKKTDNPFANLVRMANERDINLVVVDGKPVYGETSYLDALGYSDKYEKLPQDSTQTSSIAKTFSLVPKEKENLKDFTMKIAEFVKSAFQNTITSNCEDLKKGFITPSSLSQKEELLTLKSKGVDLDRVADIGNFIAVGLLTQSRNVVDPKGEPEAAVKTFPSLYTCNDPEHLNRITNFISKEWQENQKNREALRKEHKMKRVSDKLANDFQ